MKVYIPFIVLILSFIYWPALASVEHNTHKGYVGEHGMVLLAGPEQEMIASHMPLYHAPHDYQIVYRVESNDERLKLLNDDQLITILPEAFDLTKLIKANKITLKTKVYRGHFERGGEFLFDSELSFKELLYVRKIETIKSLKSDLLLEINQFEIIPVSEKIALLIHKIGNSPSFDSISWLLNRDKNKEIKCKSKPFKNHGSLLVYIEKCTGAKTQYFEFRDFSL